MFWRGRKNIVSTKYKINANRRSQKLTGNLYWPFVKQHLLEQIIACFLLKFMTFSTAITWDKALVRNEKENQISLAQRHYISFRAFDRNVSEFCLII